MVVLIVMETIRGFVRLLRRNPWALVLTFLLAFIIVDTMLFYIIEGEIQGLTLFDALYWTIITMATIGYGDIIPRTVEGRILALFTAVGGIATFTVFISLVAENFLARAIKRSMGLGNMGRADIVVVGDAEECVETIRELKTNLPNAKIVWVTNEVPRVDLNVEFIVGNIMEEETLKKGGVQHAKHIVLCIKEDSTTLYTALLCRKLNRKARMSSIVRSKKTREILSEAGVDHVVSYELLARQLASTVFEPGVARFFEMVSTATGYHDVVEVPGVRFAGEKWEALLHRLHTEKGELPLALVRDGEILVNPPGDLVVRESDRLIILKTQMRG